MSKLETKLVFQLKGRYMVTQHIDKTKIINIVYSFFNHFSEWCGANAITPSVSELEKHLASKVQMYNNGQLVVNGAADYLNRLKKFQKKYSSFQISQPLEEPLISGNRGAIYYKLDLSTHEGKRRQVFITGLFTIEDDKISRWVEVTNEKNGGNWDT